jgi:hypothetical protein
MKTLILYLALFADQTNLVRHEQIVHLRLHSNFIQAEFGGKRLELLDAPATLYLLALPPKVDSQGSPWSIEVVNLGPGAVTVVDRARFSIQIRVGETVQILSNGTGYSTTK